MKSFRLRFQLELSLPEPASNNTTGPFVPRHSKYSEYPPTSKSPARSGARGSAVGVAFADARPSVGWSLLIAVATAVGAVLDRGSAPEQAAAASTIVRAIAHLLAIVTPLCIGSGVGLRRRRHTMTSTCRR